MLLAWDNAATDAAGLTVSSEIATLPGSNVQHPHVARKWNTAAAVKSAFLVFDMLSSVSRAVMAVLGTNLTPAATFRLRASDVDPAALATLLLDTGVLASGVKAGYGAIYYSFNAIAARYWRVDFTDLTVPDNLKIGRVTLMPKWLFDDGLQWDWSVTALDQSSKVRSYGGQTYADLVPQQRVLQFQIDFKDQQSMFDNAFTMARAAGVVGDVLGIPYQSGTYISEQAVWGQLVASEPLVQRSARIFRQKFTIEERL